MVVNPTNKTALAQVGQLFSTLGKVPAAALTKLNSSKPFMGWAATSATSIGPDDRGQQVNIVAGAHSEFLGNPRNRTHGQIGLA